MMGTRATTTERARVGATDAPRLGLRFDAGRAELVLDAPLTLPGGVRLDAMRTELAPLGGRLSLSEGWRAFRHRRSTLVEARASIGLRELAALLGRELGLEAEAIALGSASLSLAVAGEALALAAELEWGWDGEDLLVVVAGARSLPLGPRAPLALAHDLGATLGGVFDRERGALRFPRVLRRVLASALLPAGLRLPATAGLGARACIEGERVVLAVDRSAGGAAEPSREALERARASAAAIAACVDGGALEPEQTSALVGAARALARELAAEPPALGRLAEAAQAYAARERHAPLASRALLRAAERSEADAARAAHLAIAAIERDGLGSPAALARAIELGTAGAHAGARTLPWEPLSRVLEGGGPTVMRARALALESAGRSADALSTFASVVRARPDDALAQRGLARCLDALGRHDEAISAWDRVAQLEPGGVAEARLRAARAALAAGHADGGIARLTQVAQSGDATPSALLLSAHRDLARALVARGRHAEALEADRALPRIADALGALWAAESADALREALTRALEAGEADLASAALRALERLLGEIGAAESATHAARIMELEARALTIGDAATLRARADTLRAQGRHAEAARVLVEVFARAGDAAVLRAAIELADRAERGEARLAVFDRALALLPPGPARDAIAARR